MMRRVRVAVLGLLAVGAAHAEAVRVTTNGSSGEGWTYGDDGVCRMVTVRHVVERGGRLVSPMLIDAAGVLGQGVDASVPPDTVRVGGAPMDAARLEVVGSLRERCQDDLGYEDLGPTLERIKVSGQALYLEKVLPSGSAELVPVTLSAINRDGKRFTVATAAGSEGVVASDSGSPVRLRSASAADRGLPLGLVTEVLDDGEAVVLRLDAIRGWARGVPVAAGGGGVGGGGVGGGGRRRWRVAVRWMWTSCR